MKKNSVITLVLTTLLPCYGYGNNLVDNGSSWLEDNNGINKIILDETDSNGVLDMNKNLIPQSNGSNINQNNVVHVIGTPSVTNNIYGGYCVSSLAACTVQNTAVVMDGGSSQFAVYGAYGISYVDPYVSTSGNVYLNNNAQTNNTTGSSADAYSDSYAYATSTGNVYVNNDANVSGTVSGATADSISNIETVASATGSVYLNNNAQASNVYGAESYTSSSSNAISTSTAVGNVYLSDDAKATGNTYGAYASVYAGSGSTATASATGNVYLKDNAQAANVYGAVVRSNNIASVTAQGNVSILDNAKLASNAELWGGYIVSSPKYYQIFNNNTLIMGANALTVSKLGNFENYNFYLNDYNKAAMANGTALITVTDTMKNNNTVEDNGTATGNIITNKSNIEISGISGEGVVKNGSTITLIDANGATFEGGDGKGNIGSLFNTQTGDKTTDIQVGLVNKTDATYTVDNVNNKITATIGSVDVDEKLVNTNVKPLAEGRLAALQNVTRGADLLMSNLGDNKPVGSYTPILIIDGGLNRYDSGSHIDSRDYRMMLGTRYQFLENLYAGVVVDYGRSNYDTYNRIEGKKVDGNGHTYNYGLSLFGKYTYDLPVGSTYTDAAISFGRTHTEFKSHDIVMGNGDSAHYKSKANYVGGLIGTGYIYSVNATSSFDTSVHYLYTRLSSDSVVLDGDKVNFEKATSSRAQLKEQYNYKANDNLTFYLAGSYEYEFNSKANANVSGFSIDAPNVKGFTGALEFGVKGTPFTNNKNFTFDLKLKGYGGKRDGASASALIGYTF